jgi:hypothetical protein
MKRQVLLVAVLGLLGFFGGGCGPAVDDADDAAPQMSEQVPMESPAETGTPVAEDEATEGEVRAFARNCQTTCSGIRSTGETCGVVGFGSTTFLGGCTKACRFARQDADAKAVAAGCQLTTCTDYCR